ncbi:MAG: sulfite exporter TauE/SafE family protein [Deltaproteobacteria bacterium]|nr:sulfite exporter TauE/SafE family protein [Deltaproteobacteria bacterium]
MHFSVSNVDVALWIPPLVAFVISFFTSMGGVSGAFLILPFQVSVLNFTSPAVSSTNLVFNIVAIPSGIYRYLKEDRMSWPLTWVVVVGTLPGVIIGAWVRILYLPDPRTFKLFVGLVLLYVGIKLVVEMLSQRKKNGDFNTPKITEELLKTAMKGKGADGKPLARVKTLEFTMTRISYEFYGEIFSFPTWTVFSLAFAVGIVGGIYGIGGGAIIAPFFVAILRLPIYTVAGAALTGTFITSVFGVIFYQFVAASFAPPNLTVAPDWLLGALFGIGGLAGIYCGARMQKYMPALFIKIMLAVIIWGTGGQYVVQYWMK